MALPEGFEAQVRPAASGPGLQPRDHLPQFARHHRTPTTRGEVKVILVNHGVEDFVIRRGERIGQLVVAPVVQARWNEVESLDATGGRGAGRASARPGVRPEPPSSAAG